MPGAVPQNRTSFRAKGKKANLTSILNSQVAVISWLLRQLVRSLPVWAVGVCKVGGGCPRCLQDLSYTLASGYIVMEVMFSSLT